MSYDLEVGSHDEPTRAQIEQWASTQGFVVRSDGPAAFSIERTGTDGEQLVCSLYGPHAADVADFSDEVAGACLAPRWMLEISVPYSLPKSAIPAGRSLARHMAEVNDGAAFDPQSDGLLWPKGQRRRVTPRTEQQVTSRVTLEWFVSTDRWPAAPGLLLDLIKRHCPEALPTRYGQFEPLLWRGFGWGRCALCGGGRLTSRTSGF